MAHLNFKKDLEIGKTTERVAAQLLKIFIDDDFDINWNDNNKYDFSHESQGFYFTVEVKDDIGSMNTPNVFVEVECRGKPSGISVTTAELHIYKIYSSPLEANFYLIPTQNIRSLIANKEYKRFVGEAGDIGSNTKGYLFAKETIIERGEHFATEKKQVSLKTGMPVETITYIVNDEKIKDIFNYFHKTA